MKRCSACGETKPTAEFNRARNTKDGMQNQCRPCQRATGRKYAASEKGKGKQKALKALEKQRDPIGYAKKVCETTKAWQAKHPEYVRENAQNRAAKKRKATPAWANKVAMRAIYARAKRLTDLTGVLHQVDHIVPLRSPYVQGFHCEANLRILTREANLAKGNRTWPDTPGVSEEWLPPPADRKVCSACGGEKMLDAFYRDSNPRNKTGRQSRCIECCKRQAAAYWTAHPEKKKESDKKYRQAHPEKMKELDARKHAARAEHYRQLGAERQRRYRERNRDGNPLD